MFCQGSNTGRWYYWEILKYHSIQLNSYGYLIFSLSFSFNETKKGKQSTPIPAYIRALTPRVLICCWLWLQQALSSKGRLESERLPASAKPPSGGRAATLTPLSPKYSTGPCCPVWPIIRNLWPDLDLGPCPAWLIRPKWADGHL